MYHILALSFGFLAFVLIAGTFGGVVSVKDTVAAPANTMIIADKSGTTQTNYPLQFARPFLQGEISQYPQVLINGTAVSTQADVKMRYPDGSVKHAVISVVLPSIPANGSITLSFRNQSTGNNTPLTVAQMLGSNFDFDATMQITNGGVTKTTSARQMLQNGDFTYWTRGQIAQTILLADDSVMRKYDMGFDALRSIRPRFYATFWPGINRVTMRVVGENSNTETLQDVPYDLKITIGSSNPTTIYTKSALQHYAASRWTKLFWLNGTLEQKIDINYNLSYLKETKFFANYDMSFPVPVPNSPPFNGALPDLYEKGYWTKYMPTTGGRSDIGLLPSWTVEWLYTGAWQDRVEAFTQADLAGAWPMQVREGDPAKKFDRAKTIPAIGKPISINARPSLWLFDERGPGTAEDAVSIQGTRILDTNSNVGGGWQPDGAHQPDPFSAQYVLSGDPFYLEELQLWAAYSALKYCPNGESYCRGVSGYAGIQDQIRGNAWILRNRVNAAFLTPDDQGVERSYFTDIVNDAIALWEGRFHLSNSTLKSHPQWIWGNTTNPQPASPLGFWSNGGEPGEFAVIDSTKSSGAAAAWMEYYLIMVLGRTVELGFPTQNLLAFSAPFVNGQVTDPSYNPWYMGAYRTPAKALNGSFFSTWAAVADAFLPETRNTLAANATLGVGGPIDRNYYDLAAAAGSMTASEPGGAAAWQWLETNVAKIQTKRGLTWAILPRTINTAPLPAPAPAPVPTPSFTVGGRVQATATLNVRGAPSPTATLLGAQSLNALGTVVGGPTTADGYVWWNINYDSGVDGWSIQDYMRLATNPTPTPIPPPAPAPIPNTNPVVDLGNYRRGRVLSAPPTIVKTPQQLVAERLMLPFDRSISMRPERHELETYKLGDWENVGLISYVGSTGDRREIGLVTDDIAEWLGGGSSQNMLAQAEAAGSSPIHAMIDGRVADHFKYPRASLDSRQDPSPYFDISSVPPISGAGNPVAPESAHYPALSYVPYLATGDQYYLEELQFAANAHILYQPNLYTSGKGILWPWQTRQVAWALRDIFAAYFATPEGDVPAPLLPKSYWKKILDNNLAALTASKTAHYGGGSYTSDEQSLRNEGFLASGDMKYLAPWQQDYLNTVLGWAVWTGRVPEWRPLYEFHTQQAIKRATGPLRSQAIQYNFPAGVGRTWAETLAKNGLSATPDDHFPSSFVSGVPSYLGYLRASLLIASMNGIPGAQSAFEYVDAETKRINYLGTRWSIPASGQSPAPVPTPPPPPTPVPAPTVTLTANFTDITAGQSTTLAWSSTNSSYCTGSNFTTGERVSGSMVVSPVVGTTYRITCRSANTMDTASAQVTVRVTSPVSNTIPSVTVANVTVTGDFSLTNNCATLSLGSSCSISVVFTPTAAGVRTGVLMITYSDGTTRSVALSGIGVTPSSSATPGTAAPSSVTYNLRVGPTQQYKTLSAAVAAASSGQTIGVDAGVYDNDFVYINKNLTIAGVGGKAHFRKTPSVAIPNGKAIFVIQGTITLENLEFSGASVPDLNGSGIRYEGGNLTIKNSSFHDNQQGILGSADPAGLVTIQNSEFLRNGNCIAACAHGIYINKIKRLEVTGSTFRDTNEGHHIKSRAAETIVFDSILDDGTKDSSYSIDIPNGGVARITGNTITQVIHDAAVANATMISYGAEGSLQTPAELTVSNNTFTSSGPGSAVGVRNSTQTPASGSGNTWNNIPTKFSGPGQIANSGTQANLAAVAEAPTSKSFLSRFFSAIGNFFGDILRSIANALRLVFFGDRLSFPAAVVLSQTSITFPSQTVGTQSGLQSIIITYTPDQAQTPTTPAPAASTPDTSSTPPSSSSGGSSYTPPVSSGGGSSSGGGGSYTPPVSSGGGGSSSGGGGSYTPPVSSGGGSSSGGGGSYTPPSSGGSSVSSPSSSVGRITVGGEVRTSERVRVRSNASVTATPISVQSAGSSGTIIGGPVQADGYTWWQVRYNNNTTGWSVANYLTPPTAPSTGSGTSAVGVGSTIRTTDRVRVRSSASITAAPISVQSTGSSGTIIGGPVQSNGYTWWQVSYANNTTGWTVADFLSTPASASPVSTPTPNTASCSVPLPSTSESLSPGMTGGRVVSLQRLLNQHIGTDLPLSAFYGARTTAAVQQFQCQYNIVCGGTVSSTGYGGVGPRTLQKLRELDKCGVAR